MLLFIYLMLLKNKSCLRENDKEIKDNCKKYKFILIQNFLVQFVR